MQLGYFVQKSDGSYVCIGTTTSFGQGLTDIYLLNLNSNGDTLSTHCYGGVNNDNATFLPTLDKGYLICGTTNSFSAGGDYDVYVLKIDSLFNLQWSKTYGGLKDDYSYDFVKTNSGNYVIAGTSLSFSSDTLQAYALSIDGLGNVLWSNIYTYGISNGFSSIIETFDNNFLFTGFNSFTLSSHQLLILTKTTQLGDTLGCKLYNNNWNETRMSTTLDSGVILTGNLDSLAFLIKLNKTYNVNCLGTPVQAIIKGVQTIVTNVATQQHSTSTQVRGANTIVSRSPVAITTLCYSTSIEQYATNNIQITVYPNPANNKVYLDTEENISNVEVYDVLGKKVINIKAKEINISNLIRVHSN